MSIYVNTNAKVANSDELTTIQKVKMCNFAKE